MKKLLLILSAFLIVGVLGIFLREGYIFYKISEQIKKYNLGEYQEIIEVGSETLQDNSAYLHNLGNTSYELYDPKTRNIETLEASLEYFKKSLSISENENTRMNHDIVKSLLQQEQEKPEQQKEDEQKQEAEKNEQEQEDADTSQEQNESEASENQETQNQQNNPQINQRDEQYKMQEGEQLGELSEQELGELEERIDQLQQEQQYNQNSFNKKPQEQSNNFGNIFDMFFDNQIGGQEKDW